MLRNAVFVGLAASLTVHCTSTKSEVRITVIKTRARVISFSDLISAADCVRRSTDCDAFIFAAWPCGAFHFLPRSSTATSESQIAGTKSNPQPTMRATFSDVGFVTGMELLINPSPE